MPKGSPIQNAFNGGQFGPRIQGRTDLARYRTGCNQLRNFLLTMQGPAVKRSGTRFAAPAKYPDKKARLIPFEFSRDQAYMLEFGDQYMRVFRDGGAVLNTAQALSIAPGASNPVAISLSLHGYSTGDTVFITGSAMTELNGRFFNITVVNPNLFSLDGEDGSGRTTGTGGTVASVYEIAMPYTEAQVFDIQTAQSQDVLYLAHPDVAPTKLERTSDTDWTATAINFDVMPFRVENSSDTTIYASATTGTAITLTASAATFTTEMIGSYVRLAELIEVKHSKWIASAGLTSNYPVSAGPGTRVYYGSNVYEIVTLHSSGNGGIDPPVHEEGNQRDHTWEWRFVNRGAGWGKITAIGGASPSTTCTVDVDTDGVEYPNSVVAVANATKKWSLSAWSANDGYPHAVAFYENRLWWGGTKTDPQAFWGSRTGQYENYEIIGDLDDAGLLFVLASDKINAIEWLSGDDVLLIGTRGSEFTVDSGSDSEAITPSNIRVRRRSNYGSIENIQPLSVDSALLFVQRSGRRIHELVYQFESDRYIAPDLTDLAYDIVDSGIVEMTYQAAPFRNVWALRSDGRLTALTYVRDEDVIGWGPHEIGGDEARAESIGTIPHPDGDEDQLWMLVDRKVNNIEARHIEYMEKPFAPQDNLWNAFFVDAGASLEPAELTVESAIYISSPISNSIVFTDPHGLTTGDRLSLLSNPYASSSEGAHFLALVINPTTVTLQNTSGVVDNLNPVGVGSVLAVAVAQVSGLNYLDGETVKVVGDGAVFDDALVVDGVVALYRDGSPDFAAFVHVGLEQPSAQLETMRLESGMEGIGSAQGRRKRIHQVVIRMDRTGDGLRYGASLSGTMDPWDRSAVSNLIGAASLYTGDTPSLEVPGGWNRDGRLAIEHDQPLPCTVVALMPQLTTEGR